MPDFRSMAPSYKCNKTFANYRSYKKYLTIDFSNRCGYCDSSDTWTGGYKSFHIDHFAPKDKFPGLEAEYNNLIYACPTCNVSKSNQWVSDDAAINIVNEQGFLHPCIEDLNNHFERDDEGKIIGKTAIAVYMINALNLHLERHSILWNLSRLETLINEYEENLKKPGLAQNMILDAEAILFKLLRIYFEYHKLFKALNVK